MPARRADGAGGAAGGGGGAACAEGWRRTRRRVARPDGVRGRRGRRRDAEDGARRAGTPHVGDRRRRWRGGLPGVSVAALLADPPPRHRRSSRHAPAQRCATRLNFQATCRSSTTSIARRRGHGLRAISGATGAAGDPEATPRLTPSLGVAQICTAPRQATPGASGVAGGLRDHGKTIGGPTLCRRGPV